jgi:photosystem II stability/assembly factor-like uncharacterized protein
MPDGPVPHVEFDAANNARARLDAWLTTLPLEEVAEGAVRPSFTAVAAGRAAAAAPGSRAVRAAADVGALDHGARANWIPTGPRNITGRVRALAVHPNDPTIMYAGAASGGVFKSIDGGETWAPSWTDAASLSIAGISICHDHPEVVWVATGEVRTGGAESILGTGIHRSPDSGATWANPSVPPVPGTAPNLGVVFDAIAAHPTNSSICWAVGPAGVFRTLDGGAHWSQYDNGTYYSDVAFSVDGGGNPVVFLVRAVSAVGETNVLRLDAPDDVNDAHITTAINAVATTSNPLPAPVNQPTFDQMPTRGKIAICSGTPNVAFVRFVVAGDGNPRSERSIGLFRTQNAQAAPAGGLSGVNWTKLPDSPSWIAVAPDGTAPEGQGNYALAICVNPTNPNEVATGMLNVDVSTNANAANAATVTYKRVIAEDLTFIDRAQHGDQHAMLIVPPPAGAPGGTPPTLWIANDGGIASSVDWQTGAGYTAGGTVLPLPAGAVTWRKSFGISASQMYSLTQNPLLPTSFGGGFQDNGVLFTSGGLTWRQILGADGGFLAFDPDDAYRAFATHQFGIDELVFPGKFDGGFALPGFPVRDGVWPRELTQGFLRSDGGLFVSDTVHHPRRGDRVLHARENRLYGSTETRGDRWQPEPAGRSFEVQATAQPTLGVPAAAASLEVIATPGAARLGLPAQLSLDVPRFARVQAVARVRSILPGPYALQDGDVLTLAVTSNPPGGAAPPPVNVTFVRTADKRGVPWTAAEVAAEITRQTNLAAFPCFWARPALVEVTTTDLGPNAQIQLAGTALTPPNANALSPLRLRARAYRGTANRPASVTLRAPQVSMAPPVGQPPLTLTLQIGPAGVVRTVTFDAATFVDLSWIHAGELEQSIRAALQNDPATVTAHAAVKRLRISGTGGHNLRLSNTALPRLNVRTTVPPAPFAGPFSSIECDVGQANSFDLTPNTATPGTALVLGINDGTAKPSLTFTGTVNDLRAMTSEELQARLSAHFTANGIAARCDLAFDYDVGSPSEIAYSQSAPDTAWVGSTDGTLYRTTNDGGVWDTVQDPSLYKLDRQVEAIAIHPTDSRIVYVGYEGRPTAGLEDQAALTKPGLLFKTTDAGATWNHVGNDVKDAAGSLLGVYALQIDAGAADTVFAATEVGVFRSTDAGASWQPFNEGLPNAIVRDLDFVAERRVLRAGVWGRGTFEREVGAPAPRDVSLYIRATDLDNGSTRPAPRGPDIYASAPRLLPTAASPDIKVSRDDPPSIGGLVAIDGVEFDEDIVDDDIVPGDATVFVQVHNRGAFSGTAVRIVCLWADASAGPPPLAGDFWTRLRAKTLDGLAGPWTLIGDTTIADPAGKGRDTVPPGYPRVQRFAVHWADDIVNHARIGIVAIVECAEDQASATQLDVESLMGAEPKAAYHESATAQTRDDRTFYVERTGRAQFTVSAPPGPLLPATALLAPAAILPIGPVSELTGDTQETFALPPDAGGNNQALTFALPAQTVTINFGTGIFDPARALLFEVAAVIDRQLFKSGAPVAVDPVAQQAGTLTLLAGGGAVFQVTGGTAAPNLGLAVGGPLVPSLPGGAPPYNLSAGAPQTLVLSVTNRATVQFSPQPGFNPAAATPRSLRRLLDREFAAAYLPLRAVAPRVSLWIRRSITDVDGRPSPVADRGLADLVASPVSVAPLDRQALFDLVKVHGPDPVKASADNFLYLRVANLGTVELAQGDSRHRIYAVAIGVTPVAIAQIGGDLQQDVPAGSSAIVEFTWNPGAASSGDRLFVLAVSDDKTHAALDPPATFPSVDALDAFCAANPSAAYRMFLVGT